MKGNSTIRFRADPAIFGAVRRFIAQIVLLSGGSHEDAAELELATGEVLANAYRHAYRKTHGPLQLDVIHDDQKIEISIHDQGDGGDGMLSIPSTLPAGNDHRGLYLVGKVTDHAEIRHPRNAKGGTTVRIVKHLSKALRLARIVGTRANFGRQLLR